MAQNEVDLPETVAAGDELDIQLAPYGDWPNTVDGKEVVQHLTGETVKALVGSFDGEVLVDLDHASETGGTTEAAAWVVALREDPEKGLMGTLKFTDKGADAVSQRRYRFVSPAWTMDADGNPLKLVSVGFTNKPNLPVAPVLNRQPEDAGATAGDQPKKQKETQMDIKQMLGLPEDASDADVATAIDALKAKAAEADTLNAEKEAAAAAAKDAEAETFANENADLVDGDKDGLKKQYLENCEGTKALCANMRKALEKAVANAKGAPSVPPVVNNKEAEAPVVTNAREGLAACKNSAERIAYIQAHVNELVK